MRVTPPARTRRPFGTLGRWESSFAGLRIVSAALAAMAYGDILLKVRLQATQSEGKARKSSSSQAPRRNNKSYLDLCPDNSSLASLASFLTRLGGRESTSGEASRMGVTRHTRRTPPREGHRLDKMPGSSEGLKWRRWT